ncbi:glycosyltransferase [bacterium]|nr:glycosyltransferase [bacterium]
MPTYNEEQYINKCIESVFKFELPDKCKTEIFIIDGGSTDQTVNQAKKYKYNNLELLHNKKKVQSAAINIGIKHSNGNWILRLDAHSIYPVNYLKICLETALKTQAENVGGLVIAQPAGRNYQAHLVQALTTHKFGVGNSGMRIDMPAGETDTVPYGFYKKEIFKKIGYFDERLVRAQDYEFHRRIIKFGGRIWRNPKINVHYHNQPNLVKFLSKQIKLDAPYNAYMWYLAPYTFAYRHAITGLFTVGVLGGIILSPFYLSIKYIYFSTLALYISFAVIASVQQAARYKKPAHIITLPISFFLYHFLHGLGLLGGIFKLLLKISPVQKGKEPWDGYGSKRIIIDKILNNR